MSTVKVESLVTVERKVELTDKHIMILLETLGIKVLEGSIVEVNYMNNKVPIDADHPIIVKWKHTEREKKT